MVWGTSSQEAEFQQVTSSLPNTDKVNFILAFVQSLPYTVDNVTTGYDEFRRYAIETLIEGGGDCEDTTILACAILSGLGYKLVLIHTPGHIAFGVPGDFSGAYFSYNNDKYYYCETTGTGWTAGELPNGIGRQAEITPITPTPVVDVRSQPVVIKSTGPPKTLSPPHKPPKNKSELLI